MFPPDLSVVVACYEEEEALPRLFGELGRLLAAASGRGLRVEVVLVDDGSTDRTGEALVRWCGDDPLRRAVAHARNRGFGAAMRTGFAAARGRVLVSYDADATYPVLDVLALRDALDRTGADVAGATPFAPGGRAEAHPLRTALSRGVAGLYRLALRDRAAGITVLTCAFRAYRREALAGISWRADDFLAAAEVLARLLLAGARVVEVPSRLTARIHGRSHMKVARTAVRHLRFVAALALRRGSLAARPRAPRRRRPRPPRAAAPAPGDLRAWNAALNRAHPMSGIERHPNPVVRGIEERRRREVVRLAAARCGELVLDVGAEEGAYARRLRRAGARPVAVDIDPAALARGRAIHGEAAVAGDANALPFRDRSVPRVILAEVLEHCPDPGRALAEALRVVAGGGRVALSVPDDGVILAAKALLRRTGLARLLGGLPPGLAPGHLHVFDRPSLRDLLAGSGRLVTLRRDPAGLAFFAVVAPGGEDR